MGTLLKAINLKYQAVSDKESNCFASLLWVKCVECGTLNSNKNKQVSPGMQTYMASLEVPTVTARTLKNRKREIRVTIEKGAKNFV